MHPTKNTNRLLSPRRRGTVLPFLMLAMVALIGFLALAIDLGMLAVARTEVQQAADLAALTAARTVNGDASSNYNQTKATTNAQAILASNTVLGQSIQPSQLQVSYGTYDYNQTTQTFSANFPGTAGTATTAVATTVTATGLLAAFSKVFGNQLLPNVVATAQAVHRPRDIALSLDLSGSMRFGTLNGYDFYTSSRTTNNPDSVYPTFGHYASNAGGLQGPSTDRTSTYDSYTISPSNVTAANASYSQTFVNSFYQNNAYTNPLIRAFDSSSSGDSGSSWSAPGAGASPLLPPSSYAIAPGGDAPLFVKGSTSSYATNVSDVVGSTARNASWELDGYSNYANGTYTGAAVGATSYAAAPFYGYTQGPGYYGKTFFLWPPDPRQPLTTASDSAQIKQFLYDFGYTSSDLSGGTTGPPLSGIYNVTSTPGSHTWPWPNDGGASLSNYLTNNVHLPANGRKLNKNDPQYKSIMRLYNWNYAVDSLGTTPCDWRQRFFGTPSNTVLFSSSGALNPPSAGGYTINYNEILRWIASGPNPFPAQLRAGRIKYYGAIPTSITGSWPSYGSTDQRFWVEYIDYVLGFRQTSAGVYRDISPMAGYGADFTWGNVSISSPPSATQYMSYADNPVRPLLRYWFGPLTIVDFMQNYNVYQNVAGYFMMQPGDGYEAPLYTAKQAYVAAVSTMESNHPNDWVTIVPYSWPRGSSAGIGRYNGASSPLGTNYNYATSALLFPYSTINADGSCNNTEVTPYDADPATGAVPSANFVDVPRADGNTCFAMALMLCYNQFAVTPANDTTLRTFVTSSPIAFPVGMAGGLGRKGAQKVVIFETDGLPNTSATANLINNGSYSYYQVRYDMNRPSASEFPSISTTTINNANVLNQVYGLVQQLATTYSTPRNPFRLYAVGFGPVFQGPNAASAQQTLQYMQYYAGTQNSAGTPLSANQIITGTDSQMATKMINTFTSILQSGVQIALYK